MVRLDLAFILCCCRACLGGGSRDEEESFYDLLGLERDASSEEIKRAYKRRSLDLHPDKIAQRGKVVTEADQARFTRMKEAYEVLSDKHKRESYDAIGEKGMKWIEEPFSMDPQEMATNFANSSTLDRSKIFAIFLGIAIAVFLFPVLLCLQVDGTFGQNSSWAAVATPLWIWNAFILFYHVRIIMMGPIERPDHIPEEEWFDPLPMSKRFIGLARFLLYFLFQILAILNLDQVISLKWYIVFIPVLVVELITLSKRMSQAKQQVVTIEELEALSGRQFADFTEEEKEAISFSYLIFPSKSEGYALAKSMQESAKTDIIKICFRIAFIALLMVQLDTGVDWSWWLVFTPFFAMSCCICCTQCQKYTDLQAKAAEKLDAAIATNAENYGAMEEGVNAAAQDSESLSEEEKNEIKTQLVKTLSTCCSQTIFLVLICLCLGKLQGAGFSSLWIISPFLFLASIILCLLGCTIFCVSPEDEMDVAYQNMDQNINNDINNMFVGNSTSATPSYQPAQPSMTTTTVPTTAASVVTNTNTNTITSIAQGEKRTDDEVSKQPEKEVDVPNTPQIVDLLDDVDQRNETKPVVKAANDDEVGPSKSEVDDLD